MKTKDVWHKSYVDFDYKQMISYKPVTKDLLDYFQHNSLILELWGKQRKYILYNYVKNGRHFKIQIKGNRNSLSGNKSEHSLIPSDHTKCCIYKNKIL